MYLWLVHEWMCRLLGLVSKDSIIQKYVMYILDVRDQASYPAVVDWVGGLLEGEGLNVLINNAGINHWLSLETVTKEMMLEDFETNAAAPLMVSKVLYELLPVSCVHEYVCK